jgi:hypothetical protein
MPLASPPGAFVSAGLLKNAHLRRWRAWALVAAYRKYASLGPSLAALHLGLFEQPGRKAILSECEGAERSKS